MKKVHFTRPGEMKRIPELIIKDIINAKTRVLISSAYFTDFNFVEAISTSKAEDKRIIFNEQELLMNKTPFVKVYKELQKYCPIVTMGSSRSIMHHKFMIIDDILWTGSYNLSLNARDYNWENIIRFEKDEMLNDFHTEFEHMWLFGEAINNILLNNICQLCKRTVLDPFTHYNIQLNIRRGVYNTENESRDIIESGYEVECLSAYAENNIINGNWKSHAPSWWREPHCDKCFRNADSYYKINFIDRAFEDFHFPLRQHGMFCSTCFIKESKSIIIEAKNSFHI